jgi:GNAT superfamily N-acetyltransferase
MPHIIRPYRKENRESVREIAWATALMGRPASLLFDGKEIVEDILTLYFTDYEPQSCFIAEVDGVVKGYLIGAKNKTVLRKTLRSKIIPRVIIKGIVTGAPLNRKNMIFLYHCIVSFLKGDLDLPNFAKTYPAILHINLKEGFRDLGIGSELIAVYADYLKRQNISGIHLCTISEEAGAFFMKQGFQLLYRGPRSFLNYILRRDVSVYIYGRRL